MLLSTQQVRDFAKKYGYVAKYTDKTSANFPSRRSVVFCEGNGEKRLALALLSQAQRLREVAKTAVGLFLKFERRPMEISKIRKQTTLDLE